MKGQQTDVEAVEKEKRHSKQKKHFIISILGSEGDLSPIIVVKSSLPLRNCDAAANHIDPGGRSFRRHN